MTNYTVQLVIEDLINHSSVSSTTRKSWPGAFGPRVWEWELPGQDD